MVDPVILKFRSLICPSCAGQLMASVVLEWEIDEDGLQVSSTIEGVLDDVVFYCVNQCLLPGELLEKLDDIFYAKFRAALLDFARASLR